MRIDNLGQYIASEEDLISLYLRDPDRQFKQVLVEPNVRLSTELEVNYPKLKHWLEQDLTLREFDEINQNTWLMPEEYKTLDIAKWLLEQCSSTEQLQRVADELFRYQELDAFDLLRYLKYLVDTMRKHNIIWGVGRGSSVSSYVLFLIGIHKIDSIYYDLDVKEFLR